VCELYRQWKLVSRFIATRTPDVLMNPRMPYASIMAVVPDALSTTIVSNALSERLVRVLVFATHNAHILEIEPPGCPPCLVRWLLEDIR
jgi:hypothetical protein